MKDAEKQTKILFSEATIYPVLEDLIAVEGKTYLADILSQFSEQEIQKAIVASRLKASEAA